jgi:hypothetical protein
MLLGCGSSPAKGACDADRKRKQNSQSSCQASKSPWLWKGFFHFSFGKCLEVEKMFCMVPSTMLGPYLCSLNNRCPSFWHSGDREGSSLIQARAPLQVYATWSFI